VAPHRALTTFTSGRRNGVLTFRLPIAITSPPASTWVHAI